MKHFTILGERCSGTIFTQYALMFNFKIDYRTTEYKNVKEKHFFGFSENLAQQEEADETLFIFVIRNPIDWIDSFFKRLHHVAPENKKSIHNFLNNEWYSIYELGDEIHTEIMLDRNMHTGKRYKDIFELRKTKNDYLINTFVHKVKNFMVLRYEDLRDNYDATLDMIQELFQLERKNKNGYEKVPRYKGTYTALYYKKPILIPDEAVEEIKKRVDIEQEKSFGYIL
jgi:hypothetical protein